MALYGIYGRHTTERCPLNDLEIAKAVKAVGEGGLEQAAKEYGVSKILGQYHSALEHTFLWVVEAEDPHRVQHFAIATGIASFNELKIVPLITFQEGVMGMIREVHGI